MEIQWNPLDFRQRSGFWWKFQRVTFASFPLEQVGAVPKGVPVSGGISGGIPLDWSSTGTGAQTLGTIDSMLSELYLLSVCIDRQSKFLSLSADVVWI